MRILLHNDDIEAWRDALTERLPDAEIVTADDPAEQRRDADYLAVWKPPAALLREQSRARGIINLGAGVDALLNNPARPEGVPIVKLRDAG
ncbi:Rossmann-fold NAD(P)-binding domain-containing protein [Billgrantia diversa]